MARKRPAPQVLAAPEEPRAASTSVRQDGEDVLISVRAKPRAHAEAIEPEREGAWPVSVRAAPSEGEANAAVVHLVARALGRASSTCSLQRGHRSREKVVRASGLDAATALAKLQDFVSHGASGRETRSAKRR